MLCRLLRRHSSTRQVAVAMAGISCMVASACLAQPPSIGQPAAGLVPVLTQISHQDDVEHPAGQSSKELRTAAVAAIPTSRLTPAAKQRIESIVERPTLYRHLPTQSIDCDPDLFLCIARQPELLVGIWEVMGITQVRTERLDEYRLLARDGSGTTCTVDLVYGDRGTHIYVADGYYDGKLVASKLTGKGVFVLRTKYETRADGLVTVSGTLDCFVQLDNLGADLIARTFGPLIGKTADNNFAETARFIGQIGLTARQNPEGLQDLGSRLPQVDQVTKRKFIDVIDDVDQRNQARMQSRSITRSADRDDGTLNIR
jgi:hypothetical protein